MRIRNLLKIMTGLSLVFSSSLVAHTGDSGTGLIGVLLHPFTGIDHLLMLVVVGIGIAYFIRKHRNVNE